METGKSKEKRGGRKEWEEEEEEDGIQDLCCRPRCGQGHHPAPAQMGLCHSQKQGRPWAAKAAAGPGLPVCSFSCRMGSPAQTTAAQAVLPPACSLRVVAGTGKSSRVFPAQVPRRHGRN